MQELQRTLAELEREEREMAAQRLSGLTTARLHKSAFSQHLHSNTQTDGTQQNQQVHKELLSAAHSANYVERCFL